MTSAPWLPARARACSWLEGPDTSEGIVVVLVVVVPVVAVRIVLVLMASVLRFVLAI